MVNITYKVKDAVTGTIYSETQDRDAAIREKAHMESQGRDCRIDEEKSYMEVMQAPAGRVHAEVQA